jgi:K+-transporting ATPase A subunit
MIRLEGQETIFGTASKTKSALWMVQTATNGSQAVVKNHANLSPLKPLPFTFSKQEEPS